MNSAVSDTHSGTPPHHATGPPDQPLALRPPGLWWRAKHPSTASLPSLTLTLTLTNHFTMPDVPAHPAGVSTADAVPVAGAPPSPHRGLDSVPTVTPVAAVMQ